MTRRLALKQDYSDVRILCEEQLVQQQYPEYVEYAKVTKRMVPYVF